MVRALYSAYDGPLYQVMRASDNHTWDIGVLSAGGYADAAAQDAFCAFTSCTVTQIYDQSPMANHLARAPAGGAAHKADRLVNATRAPLTVGGHKVYAAYFEGGMGYRIDNTRGIATGDEPETLYMVTAGKHYNNKCCFDYGNAETNNDDTGAGSMEAVYWGNSGGWNRGAGKGPWVMADLENGLWAGNTKVNNASIPVVADFVTAMVIGRSGSFALKGGDAQAGKLTTMFDGSRPKGYNPMRKQGAIILGIGGDNSDWAIGTFYEGCITSGASSAATDDAVAMNIMVAGYGR